MYLAYFTAAFWPRRELAPSTIYQGSHAANRDVVVRDAEDEDGYNEGAQGEERAKREQEVYLKQEHGGRASSQATVGFNLNKTDGEQNEEEQQVKLIASLGNMKMGGFMIFILLLVYTAAQGLRISLDYSLANWAAQDGGAKDSDWARAWFYLFGALFGVLCVRSVYLNYISTASATRIHEEVFARIMQAPITLFYDTHTVGEVLNKMARDTEIVDALVPEFMLQALINWFQVIFTFALCIWSTPWVALGIPLIGYGFYSLFSIFSNASRDVKRLESVTRSPVYSSLAETLAGLDTIRAYGDTDRFRQQHMQKMDRNLKFFFSMWMITSWMTIRLETATSLIIAAVAILAVLAREQTDEVALGLALSYGIQLTALFQRCIQLAIDVSVYMTSTERVLSYLSIPQERSVLLPVGYSDSTVNEESGAVTNTAEVGMQMVGVEEEDWPTQGVVEFRNVWFRYRNNAPVLKGLSFKTRPGERLGICGRTGAGKSSIMMALFRIAEIDRPGPNDSSSTSGIFIDGKNCSTAVPLYTLREKLAIIPQDPVLLTGTVRFQLDPFDKYSDTNLWAVLDVVSMTEAVKAMPNALLSQVAENGSNLSQGQRQLICIARALLRDAKVLVVDEGTSAVDPHTDDLIQAALRQSALKRGTTILAIAHRLSTIKDFDRVMVMSKGSVGEIGAPSDLMSDPSSMFSQMLSESLNEGEEQEQEQEQEQEA